MKNILVAGGSGLLAVNLAYMFRDKYKISLILHKRKIFIEGVKIYDFGELEYKKLTKLIQKVCPELILNTIAFTDVYGCEVNPLRAFNSNVKTAEILASICGEKSITYLHISTDHMSDGKTAFVNETCKLKPLNVYAKTKMEAENIVRSLCEDHLIVRTNFFGWGPRYRKSFSDWIINSIEKKINIKLYNDIYFSPIYIRNLFDIIFRLIELKFKGTINVSSSSKITKYKFGKLICEKFKLNSTFIHPSKINQTSPPYRPLDMSLNNEKVCNLLKIKDILIEDSIEFFFNEKNKDAIMALGNEN